MSDINEKTRIPLFALIAALPVLAGALVWVGSLSSRVEATEGRTIRNEVLLSDIHVKVIQIEEYLRIKGEKNVRK